MRLIQVMMSLFVIMFMAAGSAWSGETVNINTATVTELQKVDGIGKKIAAEIVAYREEHGSFNSVDELIRVKGIGKKRLEKIKDRFSVEDKNQENDHDKGGEEH